MIVIVSILLTIGAALFYIVHAPLITIFFSSIFLGATVFLFSQTLRAALVWCIVSFFIFAGGFLVYAHQRDIPKSFFGERVVRGEVRSVDRRLDSTVLVIRDTEYATDVRVFLDTVTPHLPGDTVSLGGTIKPPEDFMTDTQKIFPYKEFLHTRGVYGVLYNPKLITVEGYRVTVSRLATKVRFFVAETFSQTVSFPYDGIVAGMLVGYQGGISDEIETLFMETGTIHVLVLSGYNIMLLAGACMFLFRNTPYILRFSVTILAIVFLVFISGAGVASVRAGIMGGLSLFAGLLFRQYDPFRALCFCYIGFLCYSPASIFIDPGFHLSFLATFCMILVVPKIEPYVSFLPETNGINIKEVVLLSCLLPLCMAPYTMYFSGAISLSTIFANMLLAVVIPLIMVLGGLVLLISFISPVAQVFGLALTFVLTIAVDGICFLTVFPIYNTPNLSAWGVVCIYVICVLVLFRKELKIFIAGLQKSFLQETSPFEK